MNALDDLNRDGFAVLGQTNQALDPVKSHASALTRVGIAVLRALQGDALTVDCHADLIGLTGLKKFDLESCHCPAHVIVLIDIGTPLSRLAAPARLFKR
jgi:hypothetical protein